MGYGLSKRDKGNEQQQYEKKKLEYSVNKVVKCAEYIKWFGNLLRAQR